MIATVDRSLLSEAEQDVLDSLRSLGSASVVSLCGHTGRHPAEVTRALEGLDALALAETKGRQGVWFPVLAVEKQVDGPERPGVTTRHGDPPELVRPTGEHATRPAQPSPSPEAEVLSSSSEAPARGDNEVTDGLTSPAGGDVDPAGPSVTSTWRETPRRVRIVELVTERPGLTSPELAALLGCTTNRVVQLAQQLGLRREVRLVEFDGPPWRANRNHWYPSEQQGGAMSVDPDPVAGSLPAQPEEPIPPAPSSSPNEEPEPSPGGSTAQPEIPAAAGGQGLEPSPGGSASPVGVPAPREPGLEEAPSSLAADPGCPPPVPVEGAPAATALRGHEREEGTSGSQPGAAAPRAEEVDDAGRDPVLRREAGPDDPDRDSGEDRRAPGEADPGGGELGWDGGDRPGSGPDVLSGAGHGGAPQRAAPERAQPPAAAGPGAEDGARPRQARAAGDRDPVGRRVDINPSLFQRVLAQTERIQSLERQLDGEIERADDFERQVEELQAELDAVYEAAGVSGRPARVRCGFVVSMLERAR